MDRSTTVAYTSTQRALHWITALAVIALLAAGLAMNSVGPGPLMNRLYVVHWSLGVTVFPLVLARLAIRFSRPAPPLPADMPGWQRLAAHANHWVLYAILLVNPVLGYLTKSAFGGPVTYFWIVDLPPAIDKNRALFDQLSSVHIVLGFTMIAAIAAHVGAALYHGVVRRDGILSRMVTG
ncbi:cytochrome b [Amorphus coralli]|uniref:cytochrome b n=1 Tax=Amorphus coralli TaxID=340680 RepID=UPI0003779422|nr:cytochrome b [Amorphus coralli]